MTNNTNTQNYWPWADHFNNKYLGANVDAEVLTGKMIDNMLRDIQRYIADARREIISKVEKELKEVQFIYEHQWTGSDEERLCETCREVVKKRSPCRVSSHYSCWIVIEYVLATLRKEEGETDLSIAIKEEGV